MGEGATEMDGYGHIIGCGTALKGASQTRHCPRLSHRPLSTLQTKTQRCKAFPRIWRADFFFPLSPLPSLSQLPAYLIIILAIMVSPFAQMGKGKEGMERCVYVCVCVWDGRVEQAGNVWTICIMWTAPRGGKFAIAHQSLSSSSSRYCGKQLGHTVRGRREGGIMYGRMRKRVNIDTDGTPHDNTHPWLLILDAHVINDRLWYTRLPTMVYVFFLEKM